ncbi:MAG: biliverdin-producing heme oxygenase [Phycisphaerales bacterium]
MALRCPLAGVIGKRPTAIEEPLSVQLKTQTQAQHDEAEHHPLHSVLFGSEGADRARAAYVALLHQHLLIQEVFEPLLRREADSGLLRTLAREHHYHLAALRDDLTAMGAGTGHVAAVEATDRFRAFISQSATENAAALIGVFYVFEGSTNGGTIIAKRLRELLALPDDRGLRFINPHGSTVRARWAEWKVALDAMALTPVQQHAAIMAAQETFRLSHRVLGDVHARMTPTVTVRTAAERATQPL